MSSDVCRMFVESSLPHMSQELRTPEDKKAKRAAKLLGVTLSVSGEFVCRWSHRVEDVTCSLVLDSLLPMMGDLYLSSNDIPVRKQVALSRVVSDPKAILEILFELVKSALERPSLAGVRHPLLPYVSGLIDLFASSALSPSDTPIRLPSLDALAELVASPRSLLAAEQVWARFYLLITKSVFVISRIAQRMLEDNDSSIRYDIIVRITPRMRCRSLLTRIASVCPSKFMSESIHIVLVRLTAADTGKGDA